MNQYIKSFDANNSIINQSMFKPSEEDVKKYGMTPNQRVFELMALFMVFTALAAFFLKILFF